MSNDLGQVKEFLKRWRIDTDNAVDMMSLANVERNYTMKEFANEKKIR